MEYHKLLALLLLVISLRLTKGAPEARAEPEAEAQAEPNPEADSAADAEAQYGGMPQMLGYGGPRMMGGGSYLEAAPMLGGSNGCGLVNECCGMADKGCCVGGQKCFTVYDRKCRYQNQPVCKTLIKQNCVTHPIKYCRILTTPQPFNVPTFKCSKRREKKCWTYKREECRLTGVSYNYTVTWKEQQADPLPDEVKEQCYSVPVCKIVDDSQPMQRQVPQQKCENIPVPRKVCRSVPVPGMPVERKSVVFETTYTQQCYNVPRTKCTTVGCSYGGCPQPAQTCAVGGYQMQDVCAQPLGPPSALCGGVPCQEAPCQQVETPICQAAPAPCQAGPQQCCTVENERVCQQVPVRVPRTVTVMEPGQTTYKQVCDTVTDYQPSCRTIMITTTVNIPIKRCEQATEKKCVPIKVPNVQIRESEKSEILTFPSNNCTIEEVEDQHCADLDVGVDCTVEQSRRVATIKRSVCDQQRQQQYCHQVPYSVCSNNPGQICEMVPREVCQDTCPTTPSCNMCSDFVSGGGYGNCNTDTCSNFYPSSSGLATEGLITGGYEYGSGSSMGPPIQLGGGSFSGYMYNGSIPLVR